MSFIAEYISYEQTKSFSKIVLDYVNAAPALKPFYNEMPTIDGVKNAIATRKKVSTNRAVLVQQLKLQYANLPTTSAVKVNIDALLNENTFTVCTAHQPNIFTGHLYFIYKIFHAIKLADELKAQIKDCNFVPVYYMGSEDADLEELGEVNINGKKYQWQTNQTGAVGRMKIDKAFIEIIAAIEAQISVEPFGEEIVALVKNVYTLNKTIEQATFEFTNALFAAYGLVVLLPDNAVLKNEFGAIMKKELTEHFSTNAVAKTIAEFSQEYKVQTAGRAINLFYLMDDSRERIEEENGKFSIVNRDKHFTVAEILTELQNYPERFSPNVILRPVFQEFILPNIAFIGGGGELAYWLELKKVFKAVDVPYPVLVLRNSFMVINKNAAEKIKALKFLATDLFNSTANLLNILVKRESALQLNLTKEQAEIKTIYEKIKIIASTADTTLQRHVNALLNQALKKISQLEKKMLKAERLKFEAQQRQITKLKESLFPNNGLQERVDNILPYYSVYGKNILNQLYHHSVALEQKFCILTEQ